MERKAGGNGCQAWGPLTPKTVDKLLWNIMYCLYGSVVVIGAHLPILGRSRLRPRVSVIRPTRRGLCGVLSLFTSTSPQQPLDWILSPEELV